MRSELTFDFSPELCMNELYLHLDSRTPQRSCRAAHGVKHLPFCAAAIRRRRLSQWGLKPATETSRILIYSPLIEAGVFPTEINFR